MNQTTFIMFKPDAIQRGLVDTLTDIFKTHGFSIIRSKEVIVDASLIFEHYEEVIQKINQPHFKEAILDVFLGKKVVIMEITKPQGDVIQEVRDLIGATAPEKADPKSIRGMYKDDSLERAIAEKRFVRNLIHASDGKESVERELKLWFKD